jgi:hypothetical protein
LFSTLKVFPHKWDQVFWYEDTNLDEAAHTLTLTTTLKDKYVFDYASGELLNSRSTSKAFLVAGLFIIVAVMFALAGRRHALKRAV